MISTPARILLTLLIAVSVGATGCKKGKNGRDSRDPDEPLMPTPATDEVSRDLKKLAMAYYDFQDAHNWPPRSYIELNSKYPVPSRCAQATVFWGAGVGPKCGDDGCSNQVLGHLPHPFGLGKVVLFCDGSTRLMTEKEYNSALKATPLKK